MSLFICLLSLTAFFVMIALFKGLRNFSELSDAEIASVMNPDRLTQLLTQADAFTRVNSEDLDDF